MDAMTTIDLPFQFSPLEISSYKCEIILSKDDDLEWIFPIEGITESISNHVEDTIVTKCREKICKQIKFQLIGLSEFFFDQD